MKPEITSVLIFAAVFVAGEVFINWWLFDLISRKLNQKKSTFKGRLLGWIERLVIYFGLVTQVEQVVIFFGAIKIGTRITPSDEVEKRIKSEYFLVGNFVSMGMALLYSFAFSFIIEKMKSHS